MRILYKIQTSVSFWLNKIVRGISVRGDFSFLYCCSRIIFYFFLRLVLVLLVKVWYTLVVVERAIKIQLNLKGK